MEARGERRDKRRTAIFLSDEFRIRSRQTQNAVIGDVAREQFGEFAWIRYMLDHFGRIDHVEPPALQIGNVLQIIGMDRDVEALRAFAAVGGQFHADRPPAQSSPRIDREPEAAPHIEQCAGWLDGAARGGPVHFPDSADDLDIGFGETLARSENLAEVSDVRRIEKFAVARRALVKRKRRSVGEAGHLQRRRAAMFFLADRTAQFDRCAGGRKPIDRRRRNGLGGRSHAGSKSRSRDNAGWYDGSPANASGQRSFSLARSAGSGV